MRISRPTPPRHRRPALAAWLAAAALVAIPAGAAAEPRWTLRAAAAWVEPAGDRLAATLPAGESYGFEVDDGAGFGAELEYRWTRRVRLELAALTADLDADLTIAPEGTPLRDTESSSFDLVSLGVNYHHQPTRNVRLHAGLFAAITYFDDVVFFTEIGRADKLVFDDDIGFGAKVGLDLAFGADDRWLASLGARYLSAILEGEAAGQDMDFDPVIVTIGLGYRF